MSKEKVPEGFCVLPWSHFATSTRGSYRPCCRGITHKPMFHQTASVDEFLQSDFINDIRASMIKGEWHRYCTECKKEESYGKDSRRIYELRKWEARGNEFETLLKNTTTDGRFNNPRLVSIDLRLSSNCNLACRMCDFKLSSTWSSEYLALYRKGIKLSPHLEKYKPANYKSTDNQELIQQILKHADTIKEISFSGGEPTLSKDVLELVESLVERGHTDIQIRVSTNATTISNSRIENFFQLLNKFSDVYLNLSVDGTHEAYEYVRYPAKWETFLDGVGFLHSIMKPETNFNLVCTVSSLNIYEITEFIDWYLENYSVNGKTRFCLNHVHQPDFLSLSAIPRERQINARRHLEEYLLTLQKRDSHQYQFASELLASTISLLNISDENTAEAWAQLRRYSRILDENRPDQTFTPKVLEGAELG